MPPPASQPATQGFHPPSHGELLALIGVLAAVAIGACEFGYRSAERNIPSAPTPNLQWGGREGCGYGLTRVRIENWLRDGPEPTVCTPVPD